MCGVRQFPNFLGGKAKSKASSWVLFLDPHQMPSTLGETLGSLLLNVIPW